MVRSLIALVAILSVVACSAGADQAPTSSTDENLSSARHRAPSCHTPDECVTAIENGTWKVSAAAQDECVQNHDFLYVCTACDNHVCSFHPGF